MIKKVSISIIAILLLLIAVPQNSAAKEYHQQISVDPLGLIFGMFNVQYEKQYSAKNSFTANLQYWGYSSGIYKWSAIGVGGSWRFYLMQDDILAIRGFSFGPLAQINYWSWTGSSVSSLDGGLSVSIGGEASYKWIFDNDFSVEPTFKLFFPLNNLEGLGGLQSYGLGCNIGYAW